MNVLKPHLKSTVFTLISQGISQREIHRLTGIDRKTIRFYANLVPTEEAGGDSNSSTPATGPLVAPDVLNTDAQIFQVGLGVELHRVAIAIFITEPVGFMKN